MEMSHLCFTYMFNKLITLTSPFTLCVSQHKNSVSEKLCSVSQLRFHPSDTPIFLCGKKKSLQKYRTNCNLSRFSTNFSLFLISTIKNIEKQ